VNHGRVTGITPLMTAARVGNIDVIRLLLAHGAAASASEESQGQTALMWAIAENHTAVARLLVEVGAGVSARTTSGFTPLLFAAQQGNIEVGRVLLQAGANINEAAPDGIGGDTNARARYRDDTEAQALIVAVDSGHAEMALFLLERGADPNHNGAGRTALHSAVQQAMPVVIEALLARGADPNARLERGLPLLSRYIRLDNGLAPTPIGATPFWLASSYADLEVMQLLLDGGADPTVRSNDGTTPLMVAAGADFVEGQDKYGRRWFGEATPLQESALEAVALLLDLGADIQATNDNGQTALHGAVYLGGTILVPVLVERGADIDAINHRGQTPWMIAAQGEYRAGSFYTHPETGDVLEGLDADTTLGSDLGKDFAKVLSAGDTGGTDPR
jgi:ankyrin repeat protein